MLEALRPALTEIRKTTGTPSVSLGVFHNVKVIFTYSEGVRDVKDGAEDNVNIDTVQFLGSRTKGFIAAACGILVDEEQLSWTGPLADSVPFHQVHDPVIGQRANLGDALSHSTGFPQLDRSWYGADGESIPDPEDLMPVVNHIPVSPDLRAKFHYSDWMYYVVGRVIESVEGREPAQLQGWGHFIRRRIFGPLKMTRSRTNRSTSSRQEFC
jgi:CubicO group peptidase (beta-lactamase class C family)